MKNLSTSFMLLLLLLGGLAVAQPMTLEYKARYECQQGEPDHLMGIGALKDGRALVGSNMGVALVDLKTLPAQGTRSYLARLKGVDARNFYLTQDDKYAYVNSYNKGSNPYSYGFDILKIDGNTLTLVKTIRENGVLYEKMFLDGNILYVAAHAYGLRIYNVQNPENPVLLGKLDKGFVDAFAVAVDGNTAYVADSGGGLKIVDVTVKTAPTITAGETLANALGTSEDVSVRSGRVYVAAGSAGLAVYEAGKLNTRTLHGVPGAAESLCWIGNRLAVGSYAGVSLFEIGQGTKVTKVAWESSHRRGSGASLRLANDVGSWSGTPGDLCLVANWDFMDVYEVKTASSSTQPDLVCTAQRLRFPPAGGTRRVTVSNNGQGTLNISSVQVGSADFTVNYAGGTLLPGKSASFDITYKGGSTSLGSSTVLLVSNDPDENPFPIQVFGNTTYLDPGEAAPNFTVETLKRDPQTGKVVKGTPFTLSQNLGKIIWFNVFATW